MWKDPDSETSVPHQENGKFWELGVSHLNLYVFKLYNFNEMFKNLLEYKNL